MAKRYQQKKPKPTAKKAKAASSENTAIRLDSLDAVPEQYARMNMTTGFDFKPFLATNRFVTGMPKCGKSTLMVQQRNTVIIDTDSKGTRHIPTGPGSARITVKKWKDLVDLFNQMKADYDRGTLPFEHVIFDTADGMQHLAYDHLSATNPWCLKNGRPISDYGEGKRGYEMVTKSVVLWGRMANELDLGWTMIGHLKMRASTDAEGKTLEEMAPSVYPGLNTILRGDADFIWKVVRKPVTRTVKEGKLLRNITEWVHILQTETPADEARRDSDATRGSRIKMETTIELPKVRAIDIVEKAYEEAIENELTSWGDHDDE
jgi:hypothetical protein